MIVFEAKTMILTNGLRMAFLDSVIIGIYVISVWYSVEYFVNWIKNKIEK
jgi:hypothetical protein